MKHRIVLVTSVILILIAILLSYAHAHPGKTDSNDGHYDRSTGEYHYHHGYSAHQHFGGECPYNFKDKTNHSSGSSSNSSSSSSSNNTNYKKDTITFGEVVIRIIMFFLFLFATFCVLSIFSPFVNGTFDISNKRVDSILYIVHIMICVIIAIAMTIFIK